MHAHCTPYFLLTYIPLVNFQDFCRNFVVKLVARNYAIFPRVLQLLKTEPCKLVCFLGERWNTGLNQIQKILSVNSPLDLKSRGCSLAGNDNWGKERIIVSLRREGWEWTWLQGIRKLFSENFNKTIEYLSKTFSIYQI